MDIRDHNRVFIRKFIPGSSGTCASASGDLASRTNPRIIDKHSPGRALALFILELTILILFFTVLIGPIVTGIILLGLYLYAKTAQLPAGLPKRNSDS